jgi:pilus assembly protein Flp/PilA
MKNLVSKMRIAIKSLKSEQGQDLVEYALVVALIAFACVTAVKGVATNLSTAFSTIGTTISSTVTN